MSDRHQTRPYPLRMPDELRRKLDHQGALNGRSLNQEIVIRLQATFDDDFALKNSDEIAAAVAAQLRPEIMGMIQRAIAADDAQEKRKRSK